MHFLTTCCRRISLAACLMGGLFDCVALAESPRPVNRTATSSPEAVSLLQEAAQSATQIVDPLSRADALRDLAIVEWRAGNRAAADALMRQSIGCARTATGEQKQHIELQVGCFLAADQARIGNLSDALKTIATLRSAGMRDVAKYQVVGILLTAKQFTTAREVCDTIEDQGVREQCFGEISRELASDGKSGDALELIKQKIKNGQAQYQAIYQLIQVRPVRLNFETVELLISATDCKETKVDLLCAMGQAQSEIGHLKAAETTYQKARDAAAESSNNSAALLVLQAAVGHQVQALEAAKRLDELPRHLAIREIILSLARKGNLAEAQRLLKLLEADLFSAETRKELAIHQARRGDFGDAIATTKKITATPFRSAVTVQSEARCAIAMAQIDKGDRNGARQNLFEFAETLNEFGANENENSMQLAAMCDVAEAQSRAGDAVGARKTAQRTLAACRVVAQGDHNRSPLVRKVARTLSRCGLATEARKWGRTLASPEERTSALVGISEGRLSERDLERK